jgi:transposase
MKNQENLSAQSLEKQVAILFSENSFYKTEILSLKARNSELEEQLNWLKRQIFGKKSERIISDLNSEQLTFDGFENLATQEEEKRAIPAHERRKPNRNGQDKITLDPNLPVETIIIDLPEEKKVDETGEVLVKIGEEVSHKLAHKPGSYYIKEIIRPKYAVPNGGVLIAELPDSIIPKCRADDSFLAEMLTKKFADHLPLYRISEELSRYGVGISRKLLSQWVVKVGQALKPLRNEMLKRILESQNVFADETPVKFIEKESKLGYLWVICGGKSSDPPYRVYNFREDRRYDNILEILKDYHGVLHSDKYGAYLKLAESKKLVWCPCVAHIRRKFFEAESGDLTFKSWVLEQIRLLFELEAEAWKLSEEERLKIRGEQEAPIIDDLITKIKDKMMNGQVLPKCKLYEALGYFCSLVPYLKNYLKYPFARLDNNVAERAIRPVAIGRKNWLFFGSIDGGESGAVILSLVQTCRALGINPREYLEDVLRKLMGHSSQKLYQLLPDKWSLNKS